MEEGEAQMSNPTGIFQQPQLGIGQGTPTNSDDDNRRASLRRRTLRSARILWNGRSSTLECVIRDQSEGGARVRLTDPTPLPKQVELHFLNDNMVVACETCWSRGSEYGLRFLSAFQALDN